MVLNRSPTDEEVDAEVEKEQARVASEKRKGHVDFGREIEEIRSRVGDIESSLSSLQETVTASTKRVEDMLKQALQKFLPKEANTMHENMEPLSSTPVLAPSGPSNSSSTPVLPPLGPTGNSSTPILPASGTTSHSEDVWQELERELLLPSAQAVDPKSSAAGDINIDVVITSDVAKENEPVIVDVTDNVGTRGEEEIQCAQEVPHTEEESGDKAIPATIESLPVRQFWHEWFYGL